MSVPLLLQIVQDNGSEGAERERDDGRGGVQGGLKLMLPSLPMILEAHAREHKRAEKARAVQTPGLVSGPKVKR